MAGGLWVQSGSPSPVMGEQGARAAAETSRIPPFLQIRELVPESQAYMDLLAFERKLDQTIARKRMEIQEAIKKPLTVCVQPWAFPNFSASSWPCFLGAKHRAAISHTAGCSPLVEHELNLMWWGQHIFNKI